MVASVTASSSSSMYHLLPSTYTPASLSLFLLLQNFCSSHYLLPADSITLLLPLRAGPGAVESVEHTVIVSPSPQRPVWEMLSLRLLVAHWLSLYRRGFVVYGSRSLLCTAPPLLLLSHCSASLVFLPIPVSSRTQSYSPFIVPFACRSPDSLKLSLKPPSSLPAELQSTLQCY